MQGLSKASKCYCIALLAISLFQLIMIHGVVTSTEVQESISNLYVDGTDFTPLLSLFNFGFQSFIFSIQVFSAILFGTVLSLIVMLLLRRFARGGFTSKAKSFDIKFTVTLSLICTFIGCSFSMFRLIGDTFLMYAPIPVVAWFAFHLGRSADDFEL